MDPGVPRNGHLVISRAERHGPGGPSGLQSRQAVAAPRLDGSIPSPLRHGGWLTRSLVDTLARTQEACVDSDGAKWTPDQDWQVCGPLRVVCLDVVGDGG